MIVTVGGVTFDGDDSDYLLTSFTGWGDGASMRRERVPKPRAHGEFAADGFQTGMSIGLEAELYTTSVDAQDAAVDEVVAILADGQYGTMTVQSGSSTLFAEVSRQGQPQVQRDLYGILARVRLQFSSDDPRRYAAGAWQETAPPTAGDGVVWPLVWPLVWPGGGNPGRVSLTNTGKAPSAPRFQLVGGMGSAVITCIDTGARIGFDRAIASGQTVEIDVANRRATQDGNDVSRWLRYREWQEVPAGSTRRYQVAVTSPSGSPLLRGKVDSAWW